MQKIVPHLWYDKQASEAAEFYISTFPNSRITNTTILEDTPSGSTQVVSFELWGQEFQAISAGPLFKFNPSISFHVKCGSKDEVDKIWNKLSQNGQVLMELGTYPFSERYGWLQDKYGLSWQVIYVAQGVVKQRFTPVFMFVGDVLGKAEEAVNYWTSVFHPASIHSVNHYSDGVEPGQDGRLRYGAFSLLGQEFGAMDSPGEHLFGFNEAISLIVNCDNQAEIDEYWSKLSHVPKVEQCGWLKDRYGVSWQVIPVKLGEMLRGDDREKINRVTQAFLSMKKIDIAKLQEAYSG